MGLLLNADTTAEKLLVMVIAIAAFVGVMGALLLAVDLPKRVPGWVTGLVFLGPALLFIGYGLVRPMIITVYNSFFDRTGDAFVGWDNFAAMFGDADLRRVLVNTVVWVFLVPIMATFLGLIYAVAVDRSRFEAIAKALIFLPLSISFVGAGVIWRFMYEFRADFGDIQQIGLLNQVLVWLGFEPYQFLITGPWNTAFLIVVMIWIQTGFAMTVLSAAIKAIPDDIVEAARLDGVGALQMFRHVTVPAIRPALVVVLTTIAIATLKIFDIVRTMTGGNYGTSVVANEFYTVAFRNFDQGLGSALAVVLFVLVIPIVAYNVRQMRLSEDVR